MAKPVDDYKIPFNKKTDEVVYDYASFYNRSDIEWKDNYTFDTSLIYIGYTKKSTKMILILFKDILSDKVYGMMLQEFDDVITRGRFDKKVVQGKFTFKRRWDYYSVKLID